MTAQDLSEELPEGFSQSKDVSVDSVMASAVKTVLHLETYSIFCTIVRALRDILEQTVETRDKERMHVGIPSLSNMVAGQVGAAILEEKEEDAMDEIYQYVGDLSAGDYMRNLLRGHAIEILRAEVEEGLFSECGGEHGAIVGTRLVAVFIKLLLEFSAFNEASLPILCKSVANKFRPPCFSMPVHPTILIPGNRTIPQYRSSRPASDRDMKKMASCQPITTASAVGSVELTQHLKSRLHCSQTF